MNGFDQKNKKTPMRRRLFLYMLVLVVIMLAIIASGFSLLGNYVTAKDEFARDLSFQSDVFERQVDKYYDDLTMMGTSLSNDIGEITECYLVKNAIEFDDINDSSEHVTGLQSAIFSKLHEDLLKTDCSGAFVIFNATVNTGIENAEYSKTGLYFQRSTIDATDESVLLYRGISELGRNSGIMPHRKWRLEFRTDLIPGWNELVVTARSPIETSAYLLDAFELPGTSERAMHFIIPIISSNGVNFGFCGFEISESYFKTHFAQATQIEQLTCMLTKKQSGKIDPSKGFSAGVFGGYYLAPSGVLNISSFGSGLVRLNGSISYIAKNEDITLCNGDYVLTVMIPKDVYDKSATSNTVRLVIFIVLLLAVAVIVCIFFSRKFLAPLLKGLEQIRKQEHRDSSSSLAEIDDLFAFLAEQDKLREEEHDELKKECASKTDELTKAQNEIARLSYSRKSEVDPDDYEIFKTGMKSLTKMEKTVFELYLEGKTAEEILEICAIQKSTLKYHNHNILGKLGVSSRKQMLRYATLLKQESGENL